MSSNVIFLPTAPLQAARTRPPAWPRPAGTESGTVCTTLAMHGLHIAGPAYLQGPYRPDSTGFRYRLMAEKLLGMAVFWRAAMQPAAPWAATPWLHVHLSDAPHETAAHEPGRLEIGAAAAPRAAARAMGSAILHRLRPELWDLAGNENTHFRRGFADAAALLAALGRCAGAEERSQARQSAITPFSISMAETVELLAAASTARRHGRGPAAHPVARTAHLLADAVRCADLAADFVPQVAAEMTRLAWQREGARVGLALADLFERHWLLARSDLIEQIAAHEPLGRHHPPPAAATWMTMDGSMIDCDRPVAVCTPARPPRVLFERPPGSAPIAESPQDLRSFLQSLKARQLIERPMPGAGRRQAGSTNPAATGVLQKDGPAMRLRRLRFITA
jgi:hypothetical protein